MVFLLALIATLALGGLIAYVLARPAAGATAEATAAAGVAAPPAAPAPVVRASSVRWWVLLHHGVVGLGAAAVVVALVLPAGLLGGQQQSGLWGGFLGQFAVLGFFWVLAALVLTLLLGQVERRVSTPRAQAAAVGGIWALTLLLGAAVAIIVLT